MTSTPIPIGAAPPASPATDWAYVHDHFTTSANSAASVASLVMDMLGPASVVDFGCGPGAWLQSFAQCGVADTLGIDGPMSGFEPSLVEGKRLMVADLGTPIRLERRFDLAVCLEVAEHLPEECSATLVENLVLASDTILFAAAIPGQGGQHHVNEQWPQYWQRKFALHGYDFQDCLRDVIWDRGEIDWWYRQNIFIVKRRQTPFEPVPVRSLVHPEMYLQNVGFYRRIADGAAGLGAAFKVLLKAVRRIFLH